MEKEMEKGKEYDNEGKLFFEGEYLNGKRWIGKGKEYKKYYDNSKIIFKGEYLNGERNGKGKEYYFTGDLIFEGEYLNGNKWNGKGYDKYGNIIYELKNGNGYFKRILS